MFIIPIYVNAHSISMLYNFCETNDNLRAPFLTMQDIRFLLAHMESGCKKRYGSGFVRFIPGILDIKNLSYSTSLGDTRRVTVRTGLTEDDDPSKRFATRRVSQLEFTERGMVDKKWDKMVKDLAGIKTNKMTLPEIKEIEALENMDFLYNNGVRALKIYMDRILYKSGVSCGLYFYGQSTETSIAPIPAEIRKSLGDALRQTIANSMLSTRFFDRLNAISDSARQEEGGTFMDIQQLGLKGYSFDDLVLDMKYAIEVFNKRGFSKLNRELWERNNGEFMEHTGRKHYLINFLIEYEEKIKNSTNEDEKRRYQELIDVTKRSFVQSVSERT